MTSTFTSTGFKAIGSIAFEYITRRRCGEKVNPSDYLSKIGTEEGRQAFLSLIKCDEEEA